MPDLSRYSMASYQEGGRGPLKFDCWGIFRDAFHHLYDRPLLPSYGGLSAVTSRGVVTELSPLFVPTDMMTEGCAVVGYVGQRSVHIGLAISKTKVFHASQYTGIGVESYRSFCRNAGARVEIYRWQQ
jgi:cell wall-associated NlpC family hydrolase